MTKIALGGDCFLALNPINGLGVTPAGLLLKKIEASSTLMGWGLPQICVKSE